MQSKYYTVGPKRVAGPTRQIPGALLQGDSWHVAREDGDLTLFYLKGEHGGGEGTCIITENEFSSLKNGTTTADDILNARYNEKYGLTSS